VGVSTCPRCDEGEDLIEFINNYQRQNAQQMAESGELRMGNDPIEVDQE